MLNGGSLSRVAGENVGVYGINQGGLGLVSSNYTLNYQGNNLTITKALLNVIADAKTKVYGDADPSLTYQVSGLKNGDTAGAVLNGVGRWSMLDIFVIAILVALVNFGNLASIEANLGAAAFASVVVLTMLAAVTFDPRLIWDNTNLDDENE